MIRKVIAAFFATLLSILLFLVVLPALVIGLVMVVAAQFDEQITVTGHTVAVVELNDQIIDTTKVVKQLYKQADDESVQAIVLRIDSPGGGVGASQDVFSAVKSLKARKPIVASMGGVAASGGLYAALGASKILAQPGTITGSIGVIAQFPNFSSVTERFGVQMTTVKSGKLKDAGNPFRPMTEEDHAFLQSVIDAAYEDFVAAVAESRGIAPEKAREFSDGRIILGRQAKELNLIDGFGGVYDAARLALELAGAPLAEGKLPKLSYPGARFDSLRDLLQNLAYRLGLRQQGMSLEYRLL